LQRFAPGITSLSLRAMLQEYQTCVKDSHLTESFIVADSKTLRKIRVGEVIELIESSKKDDKEVERVKCRALADSAEGYVTMQGNLGTVFFEPCAKPWFCFNEDAVLEAAFQSGSEEVRKMRAGEVLEALEGPRREPAIVKERVKGKAVKDGKIGWVTLKDGQGSHLELTKLLVCKSVVAITTAFDIKDGKAIRKLKEGEVLELIEEGKEDEERKFTRLKVKTKSDDKEGWVTKAGNQGTTFVEESETHYVCTKRTKLDCSFGSGMTAHRDLEEGEIFEVFEGPETETLNGSERVRGRVSFGEDALEGWFSLTRHNVQPWAPRYKCKLGTVIHNNLEISGAKAVRRLEVGEELEALEVPAQEKKTGVMRVKARAEKDGAVGYVTVKGNQGTVILQPILSHGGASTSTQL